MAQPPSPKDKFNSDIVSELQSLKRIRNNIPQLLFIGEIRGLSMMTIRDAVLEFKEESPEVDEIDFVLNSPGGLADHAYRIIRTLRDNFKTVNIIIPFWAKSAATLLALGGTRIIMDEFGEFGPLDAQMSKIRDDSPTFDWESALNDEQSVKIIEGHFFSTYQAMYVDIYQHELINISKNELSKQLLDNLSRFYEPLLKQIDPYRLGEKRRVLDIGGQYAKRILLQFGVLKSIEETRQLVNFLVDECPDHGYVVDYRIIKAFLPEVVFQSQKWGDEYKRTLSNVSKLLMDKPDDVDFLIGFIPDDLPNEDSEENQEEEEDDEQQSNDRNSATEESPSSIN